MDLICNTSLATLYNTYSNMKYYGKYSTFEIDSMIPFEREIYFGLLNKIKEDEAKIN